MRFSVLITKDAEQDLEQLFEYIAESDGTQQAVQVIDKIGQVLSSLSDYPFRGSFSKELLDLGIKDFREVFFKPYRIIYEVVEPNVNVLMVADGRRNMRRLLERRLLEA